MLLDFTPPSETTLELSDTLTTASGTIGEGSDAATVTARGGLAGTGAQGRVNPYPADVDLTETIRVEAHDATSAGAALATSMQRTVQTATEQGIIFISLSVGIWPPESGEPRAGNRIRWSPGEVEAGQKVWYDDEGVPRTITLAQAFSEPGDQVVNTFWRGPIDENGTYGEITKVMTYEAIDSDTGEQLFATPSIGQAYQTVSFGEPMIHDTNRLALIDQLKPQIGTYYYGIREDPNPNTNNRDVLKAVKRAYTVARMLNDILALNDLAPLTSSDHALAHQVTEHVDLFATGVVQPGGVGNAAFTAETAIDQANHLQSDVAGVHAGAGQVMRTGIDAADDVRDNQAFYLVLHDQVLPELQQVIHADIEFNRDAGEALFTHGYIDEIDPRDLVIA